MEPPKVLLEQIEQLLSQFKPEDIYRPVHDNLSNLIVDETIPIEEKLVNDFNMVNFKDKTIIDLGCNLSLMGLAFVCYWQF